MFVYSEAVADDDFLICDFLLKVHISEKIDFESIKRDRDLDYLQNLPAIPSNLACNSQGSLSSPSSDLFCRTHRQHKWNNEEGVAGCDCVWRGGGGCGPLMGKMKDIDMSRWSVTGFAKMSAIMLLVGMYWQVMMFLLTV